MQSLASFSDVVAITCTADNPQITCSPGSLNDTPAPNHVDALNFTVTHNAGTATTANVTVQGTSHGVTRHALIPITVTVSDFTLTAANGILDVGGGGSSADVITVAPLQGFAADVTLSCTVSASLGATTCSLTPATITGGSGNATLLVKGPTSAANHGLPGPVWPGKGSLYSLAFAVGVVFTANAPRPRRRKKHAVLQTLGLLFLLAMLLPAASCGGGGGGNNNSGGGGSALNGIVTVQATGGGLNHSTSISVAIN